MQSPVAFLREIPLFKYLTEQELYDIVRACTRRQVPSQTVLCKEGDASLSMYIIERGQVQVTKRDVYGKELALATLRDGSVIGEMSLIDPGPRSATLTTGQETVVYEVTWENFEFLKRNGLSAPYKVLKEIARELCRRLRDTDGKLENFIAQAEQLFSDDIGSGETTDGQSKGERLKRMFEQHRET